MFTHIKDSVFWVKAHNSFQNKDFVQALSYLLKIRGPRKNSSEYFAKLATVHIGLLNQEIARDLLLQALNGSEPTKSEYKSYINVYCHYYLNVVDGNQGNKVKYLQKSLLTSAPAIIKRWLPLS